MPFSQNGWPANDRSRVRQWNIPGTTRNVTLQNSDAGFLLCDFAAWFDKNIEDIEAGIFDDWGYAERPIRGGTDLSNHASGTALDLNAVRHPLAVVNTFTVPQRNAIRAKLRDYRGVIRWGGDYTGRKDEMHFEINASPGAVAVVAQAIRSANRPVTPPAPPAPPRAVEEDFMYIKCQPEGEAIRTAILAGPMFIWISTVGEVESADGEIAKGATCQWVELPTWNAFDMRSHALCDNPRPVKCVHEDEPAAA